VVDLGHPVSKDMNQNDLILFMAMTFEFGLMGQKEELP